MTPLRSLSACGVRPPQDRLRAYKKRRPWHDDVGTKSATAERHALRLELAWSRAKCAASVRFATPSFR